jgi:hypothetical protein
LTADDVLGNAENGFLYYLLTDRVKQEGSFEVDKSAPEYETWTVPGEMAGGGDQTESKVVTWVKAATACTVPAPRLKTILHTEAGKQPGNSQQLYLAQKLGVSYWQGGVSLEFIKKDAVDVNACNYQDVVNGACKGTAKTSSQFCGEHTCPSSGCKEWKSMDATHCSIHLPTPAPASGYISVGTDEVFGGFAQEGTAL